MGVDSGSSSGSGRAASQRAGYDLRPLSSGPTDLAAVVSLAELCLPHDPISPTLIAEKLWGDPGLDAACSIVAVAGTDIIGCAPVAISAHPDEQAPCKGYLKLVAVHPRWRRQGVATTMLARIEGGLRAAAVRQLRVCDQPANYLAPGVDARYAAAHRWLAQAGFERDGQAVNLICDLLQLPTGLSADRCSPLEGDGVVLRRARATDGDAAQRLIREHFHGWESEVARVWDHAPISCWLAVVGGQIVGFAATEGNNRGTGSFGPMGTAPAWRGRGIGQVLCLLAMEDLRRQGHEQAVIPWAEALPFYAAVCGARVQRELWRYEKGIATWDRTGDSR